MTNNENSGGVDTSQPKNSDQISESGNVESSYTDEELIMELDNMLEEDPDIITVGDSEDSAKAGLSDLDINEADLERIMDEPENVIDSDGILDLEEDVIDLDEDVDAVLSEFDEGGLSEADIIESGDDLFDDDIIELAEDGQLIEEIQDGHEKTTDSSSEDDMLELGDLVSDETLQYDPLLSKSRESDLYITEEPKKSGYLEDHVDIDLTSADYVDDYDEAMELEITSDMDISEDSFMAADSMASGVSIEQIEAAVERVVQRLFIEKMETMLAEVIERVVREELSSLKKSLTD